MTTGANPTQSDKPQAQELSFNLHGLFSRPRKQLAVNRALLISPEMQGARYVADLLSNSNYLDIRDAMFSAGLRTRHPRTDRDSLRLTLNLPLSDCRKPGMHTVPGCHGDILRREAARLSTFIGPASTLDDMQAYWGAVASIEKAWLDSANEFSFFAPDNPFPNITVAQATNISIAYKILNAAALDAFGVRTRVSTSELVTLCEPGVRLLYIGGNKLLDNRQTVGASAPLRSLFEPDDPIAPRVRLMFDNSLLGYAQTVAALSGRDAAGRPMLTISMSQDACERYAQAESFKYGQEEADVAIRKKIRVPDAIVDLPYAERFISNLYHLYDSEFGVIYGKSFTALPVLLRD